MPTPIRDLDRNIQIVDEHGMPTPFFMQFLQDRGFGQTDTEKQIQVLGEEFNTLEHRNINTTAPLSGGGDLTADRTLTHDDSGVTPGSYTSADITVDEFGHVTAAANGAGGGGGMTLLGSVVAAGGETALTVSGIPGTSTHLKVIASLQGSVNSSNCRIRFNADATAGAYDRFRWYGGSGSGQNADNSDGIYDFFSSCGTFGGSYPGNFSPNEMDVHFYAKTDRWKSCIGLAGAQDGGSINPGYILMARGRWRNTSAITSLTVSPGSGTFNAGATVEVWGIG